MQTDHTYCKLESMDLPEAHQRIAKLEKENKMLKKKVLDLKTKFASVKDIVRSLKKEQLVPDDKAQQIQSKFANLQVELANSLSSNANRSRSYSAEMKKFALYLYYCSTSDCQWNERDTCAVHA